MEAAAVAADAGRRAAKLAEAHGLTADVVRDVEAAAHDAAAVRIEAQANSGDLSYHGHRERRCGDRAKSYGADFGQLGVSKSESSRWLQVAAYPPTRAGSPSRRRRRPEAGAHERARPSSFRAITPLDNEPHMRTSSDPPADQLPQPAEREFHPAARQWLVSAGSIEEVDELRARAEAVRVYTREAKLGREGENAATEIRLRAERRVGELRKEMELARKRPRNCRP